MKLKTLLLIAICIISFDSFAQYIETGEFDNFYILPNRGYKYVAKKYNFTDGKYIRVRIYDNGKFTGYKTSCSGGYYIAFQYYYMITTGRYANCEQVIFSSNKGKGSGYYAFVFDQGWLRIVDLKTDEIISTFDIDPDYLYNRNISIYVDDFSSVNNELEPSFWIRVGGTMFLYNGFPAVTTSAKSITIDNESSERKYNLAGVEIENPKNEVYIQNGKKYIAK